MNRTTNDWVRLTFVLAHKDWQLFWADRRAALLAFVVPVLLAALFGMIFETPKSGPVLRALLVAPHDSAIAQELQKNPRLELEWIAESDLPARVQDRQPGVAIVVPANGRQFTIEHHPLAATEARWAEGLLTECLVRRAASEHFGVLAKMAPAPFDIQTRPAAGPRPFDSYAHSFSGMTIQYLLFWGMESGLLLLRERSRGVWSRMRAAPVPLRAILAGKVLCTATIAFLQVLGTFFVGWVCFGIHIDGSLLGFGIVVLALALVAAAAGLCVAALGGTEARARNVSVLVILGLSMLGGLWVPAFVLPGWVRDVSQLLPTTWAMRGLDAALWQGHGLSATLLPTLMLLMFAAGLGTVALRRFRRLEPTLTSGVAPACAAPSRS
ncbi:MAG: ABC transporter permease [Gemmataceae bacterium]